jgi:hypothetical protein
MRAVSRRLTYANVMSSIAIFLVLGGAAFAAVKVAKKSVGPKQLKANAVTAKKIKKNAVTKAKIAKGAVSFGKFGPTTNLLAAATGTTSSLTSETPSNIPLSTPIAVTPKPGVLNLVHIEVRGSLGRTGGAACNPEVQPLVNGGLMLVANGYLGLSTEAAAPSNFRPVLIDSESAPIGLTQPGVKQEVTVRVIGDPDCTSTSGLTVGVALTRER